MSHPRSQRHMAFSFEVRSGAQDSARIRGSGWVRRKKMGITSHVLCAVGVIQQGASAMGMRARRVAFMHELLTVSIGWRCRDEMALV